nr:hypothetical protein GCM10025732_37920 [Glycomyces mayteni]
MGGGEVVDLPRDLDAGLGEDDEVVAHALDVGDEVGGEDHRDLHVGDELHEGLEERAARERVEGGDGLVEDEQLGAFGGGEGERELGPLAPERRPAFLAGSRPVWRMRASATCASQPGLSFSPSLRWSATVSWA